MKTKNIWEIQQETRYNVPGDDIEKHKFSLTTI